MPGDLEEKESSSHSTVRGHYRSQKQCQKSSFAFYQAVRDLLAVWILEDMRSMEVFHWEDDGRALAFSPSEALLYAVVHDHMPYARYLLATYSLRALDVPSRSFCCCPASAAPHITVAVRYNRTGILRLILQTLKGCTAAERSAYLNRRGCSHLDNGRTPLHLACDLGRPECVALLLGHTASPYVTDCNGDTPLDSLLRLMCHSDLDRRRQRACLRHLLLFMPELRFSMRRQMREQPDIWTHMLGEQTFLYLSGWAPPTLFVCAMQTLIRTISPDNLPDGLEELPVPTLLKPLDVRL
ncbi:ankyrin repeat domain-containing protein 9 [Erpetoichthys calabaricus]|uniref:Ankyrin repeat domain 9 n=1 Tax=Erpetoichthys calabaricus TaxID=27687 RepID=A0A8C4TAQ0_ERPCA|nr:ankyrin repeat domain-containing protein 9 [Erpetoichthys calabaricus]